VGQPIVGPTLSKMWALLCDFFQHFVSSLHSIFLPQEDNKAHTTKKHALVFPELCQIYGC